MKPASLLGAALVALVALAGGDAAKCGVKTRAPVPASTPMPSNPPAPPAKLPTPSRPMKPAMQPSSRPPTSMSPAASDSDNAANATSTAKRSAGCGKPATIKTGSYKINVNGKQRDYMVRVPQNYDSNKPYRVVFTFHWRGGTMMDAAKLSGGYYGLEPLAKESTIFVSPQGLGGRDSGWPNIGGEDIKLVDMLVQTIDKGLCVNENLRFATGFSYGAAMSHSVACSFPDKFRGISLYSGGPFSGCAGGKKPIAYMVSHGLTDDQVPISKGRELRDHFVKVNGCTPMNPKEPARGSGTHIKTEYKGCSAGHPVVYIAFDGSHTATPADRGKPQWAPSETWAFFSQFS